MYERVSAKTDIPSLKLTLQISGDISLGELQTFCRAAELSGVDAGCAFMPELDGNDDLWGLGFYITADILERGLVALQAEERLGEETPGKA